MAERRRVGSIERSVRAYLRSLSTQDAGLSTFAEMATRLARSYDEYTGTDLSKLARLNMELRQTLSAIAERAKTDEQPGNANTPEWTAVPSAVRDTTHTGAPNHGRPDS